MNQRNVIVLCGLSGAGKSTWASREYPGAQVCSADHHFMVGSEYRFDPRQLPSAHGACLRRFTDLVSRPTANGVVLVDNTNTTLAEVAPYAALALAFGWNLEIVILQCPLAVAAGRNRHGVPERTVQLQAERLCRLQDTLPAGWPTRVLEAGI